VCGAQNRAGVATWSIEYRTDRFLRVVDGRRTFQDVAAGCDYCGRRLRKKLFSGFEPGDCDGTFGGVGHLAFLAKPGDVISLRRALLHSLQPKVMLARSDWRWRGAVDLRLTCDSSGYFTFCPR